MWLRRKLPGSGICTHTPDLVYCPAKEAMQNNPTRPRLAKIFTVLMGLAFLEVILQGFLFSGFYSRGESAYIDIHGMAGELTGGIILVVLIPMSFFARFPRHLRVLWWTVLLAILWNVQSQIFGYGIEDVRWFEMVHIPLAFGVLLLALYITIQTRPHSWPKE